MKNSIIVSIKRVFETHVVSKQLPKEPKLVLVYVRGKDRLHS